MEQYLHELRNVPDDTDSLTFWGKRRASHSILAPMAEDLIAAPASQAFAERILFFSVQVVGRRNRLTQNLEMRVFLKLNRHLSKD